MNLAIQAGGRIPAATIGFDFDGVIADTVEAFIRLACEQYNHCGIHPDDITDFTVEHCLPMNRVIADSIFSQILHDSLGTGLKPMPGALEVLEAMSLQADLTIVTARPEAQPVHEWLAALLPSPVYRRTRVVAMGDHDDKVRHVQSLGLSTFIDDRAETCVQMHQAGIQAIVFAQPWNRYRHTLPTVRSWAEIRDLCL